MSESTGAVQRARDAAPGVAALTVSERLGHLAQLRGVILQEREAIIDEVQEATHKSRSDILVSEVFGVLDALVWLESHADDTLGDAKVATPLTLMGKKSSIQYSPLGVVVNIAPWNYPFYQAMVPIAFALAAGNAVVHKPSEWTPLPGLVERLCERAAIAPHWVQVVYGDGAAGADLVAQAPDKVIFTGSARTGRTILKAAADNLTPVELELGGKDPMIVFADVTLERAVAGAAWGGLTATGQSCTSVERIYVERSVYAAFVDELDRYVTDLVQHVDDQGEARGNADIGAMTTPFQVETVARHVRDAVARGARQLTGASWDFTTPLIPPIVLVDVPPDAAVLTEETFGPVLPVVPFDTEEEAIRLANDTAYGLTASVWSADLDRAERVARALRCGGVSINNVMATEATPALPFGGVGESGMGRIKGVEGLRSLSNAKSVLTDKDSGKIEANWFPYTHEKYRLFTALAEAWAGGGATRLAKFAAAGTKLENYAKKAKRP